MLLKQADRSATLSFCPTGPFLAAGSVAGAIDLSFSTSSVLEVRLRSRCQRGGNDRAAGSDLGGCAGCGTAVWGVSSRGAANLCCRFSGLTSPAPTMI